MAESYSKVVTSVDIENFAELSGDRNPLHLDDDFAATTIFKGRIAHGFLSASFISTVIGTKLPGPGAIYMSQSLKFLAPVRIGDIVTAQVTVMSLNNEKNRAILLCACNVNGEAVIEGEAMVKVPSRAA
ncbi:MAG: MaoC family dehydratase [Fimbriimonadaceae bacterium]|nr:MaoC family dehydratase [Alphaproteobacteria bacterium]